MRALNAKRDKANGAALPHWNIERLKRAVKRFVAEGLAEPNLLRPATRRASSERLLTLVAGIARANPDLTLAQIGAHLEGMYERTPRGGNSLEPVVDQEPARPRQKARRARPRTGLPLNAVTPPPPCVDAPI